MMTPDTTLAPTRETGSQIDSELPQFSVLGVRIHNATRQQAIALVEQSIRSYAGRPKSVFFVNTHTLNLAAADPSYRDTLNAGDFVFADGTGVRWAARLQAVGVRENLPGTDLVPELFRAAPDRGYSYFLLGADATTIAVAADYARLMFPGWRQAGFRHGYLTDDGLDSAAIDEINATRPDVLLVGMGNPLQEKWIQQHLRRLNIPVCMGVGGLFDFWAGNVSRAPRWLRRVGHEWLWRLWQQPRQKALRYLIGNPLFLARVLGERWRAGRIGNRP
jgi:N-acetylglucosaminyldiphosphoundecaprenol N-acetyl-beta-D-mannosaminyltransferase